MKKVVITGATGMIGLALTEILIQNDIKCLLLVRKNTTKIDRIPKSNLVELAYCDLTDLGNFESSENDYDAFFHLGWDATIGTGRDNTYLQENNVKITLDAVKLAHKLGCKSFVGAGSQAEYGLKTEKLSSNLLCDPVTGYGIAKYSAGKLSKILAEQLNMKHCWSRILSIFGKYDNPNTLISYVINSLKVNESPKVTLCEQEWDYLYVKDCARALYLIAKDGIHGKVYPIGSGKTRKLKEYLEVISEKINSEAVIDFGAKEYNTNQVMYLCADISDLTADTGFKPIYSFEDGINEILNNN